MTTKEAAAAYEAEHRGRPVAVFNPHDKPVDELPRIYGFNGGDPRTFLFAVLLAEDGTHLGGHAGSSEGYMPADLGILEGTRPDRHEQFRQHYPEGYSMEFVGIDKVESHSGLLAAFKLNQAKRGDDNDE